MLEGPGNQTWRIIHSLWSEQDDVIARDKISRVKSKDFLSFFPVLSLRRGHRTQVSAQVTEDTSHCNAMTSSQTRPGCTIYNAIRECVRYEKTRAQSYVGLQWGLSSESSPKKIRSMSWSLIMNSYNSVDKNLPVRNFIFAKVLF